MRVVALEEHFITPAMMARVPDSALLARGWPTLDKQPARISRASELGEAGPQRIADMDAAGITLQVLSAGGPGAELLDPADGRQFAKDYNDSLHEIALTHPTRFAGFAHLPMTNPMAAADELERAVIELGFKGGLINGTTSGAFLDDDRYEPLLARAEALGKPLYIHPSLPPKAVQQSYYSGLPAEAGFLLSGPGFGWHAETAVHVLRLVVAGKLDRHPHLKIIVGHMGEGLPVMMDRSDEVFADFADRHLKRSVAQTLRDQLWITTSGFFAAPPFAAALLAFGAERIMFSVDYPFSSNQAATRFLDRLPVTNDDRIRIAHANADDLLGLTS